MEFTQISPYCFLVKQKCFHTVLVKSTYFAGSRFEPVGKCGLAHLAEHLLSDEMEKSDSTSIDEYNYISEINGMIEREYCNYWIKTTLPYTKRAISNLTSLLSLDNLSDTNFESEKQAIVGAAIQYKSTEDAYYLIIDSTYDALYGSENPLSHTEVGYPDTCKSLTFTDYNEFYKKYYKRGKKAIVIFGDIGENDIDLNLINHVFKVNDLPAINQLPAYKPQIINIDMPIGTTEISIATRIDKTEKVSRNIIDLCGFILGKSPHSILYRLLRSKHGLVYDILTRTKHFIDTSVLMIYLGVSEKDTKQRAIDVVYDSLQNIQNLLKEDEFEVFKKAFCEKYLMNFDNPSFVVDYMLDLSLSGLPVYSPEEFIQQIYNIRLSDVISFFNKFLSPNYLSIVIYN